MKPSYRWVLTARRSNGEVLYLVENPTQGTRMIPNALSLADTFVTAPAARQRIPRLSAAWKGLTNWKAVRIIPDTMSGMIVRITAQ